MAKKGKIDVEKIYSGEVKIPEITLDDLIADAVARKSKEGLEYLQQESTKQVKRTLRGVEMMIDQPLNIYRINYLKKYCGYKTKAERAKEADKQAKKDEERQARADKFAKAFAELGE